MHKSLWSLCQVTQEHYLSNLKLGNPSFNLLLLLLLLLHRLNLIALNLWSDTLGWEKMIACSCSTTSSSRREMSAWTLSCFGSPVAPVVLHFPVLFTKSVCSLLFPVWFTKLVWVCSLESRSNFFPLLAGGELDLRNGQDLWKTDKIEKLLRLLDISGWDDLV